MDEATTQVTGAAFDARLLASDILSTNDRAGNSLIVQEQLPDRSGEWTWMRIAASHRRGLSTPIGAEGEDFQAYQARHETLNRRAGFARGRVAAISTLLRHRHGGPCDTDDAIVWLRAALPFIAEAAELTGGSAYTAGLAWALKHCPVFTQQNGLGAVADIITEALECRDLAEKERQLANTVWCDWLLNMNDLKQFLRPTFEEVTELRLKGWSSIDRPDVGDLKARAAMLQRKRRRDRGVKAQSDRNTTRENAALAASCGVSLRTVVRWIAAGTLDDNVKRRLDVAKVTFPYTLQYGSVRFETRPDNDNTSAADDMVQAA